MPFYTSTDQFYTSVRALFTCVEQSHASAADAILASRLAIRMRLRDPAAEILINGRQRPVHTTFGPNGLRPDLDIELAADTLHRILLGELSLTKALGSGLLKVKGPIWKTLALAELFRQGQMCYPGILREQGLVK